MKKATKSDEPAMLEEYDFAGGVRGRYVDRCKEATNVALLAPDVAAVFRDSESANEGFRMLIRIAREADKQAG